MAKQAPKSNMRYDVASLGPGETMLSRWPELGNYAAFSEHGADENDPWLRFVAFYADAGSDYRDLPLEDKKRVCLDKAGVPAADPRRVDVMQWLDMAVVLMMNQYIRLQNSLKYALWFHGCEAAYQTIERLSVPVEATKDPEIIFVDEDDEDNISLQGADKGQMVLAKKITFYGRAIIKAFLKGKGKVAGEMDEAKTQVAYKTRHDNLDAMFKKVPELEKLGSELFMGDDELREQSQQANIQNTPTAERRAEGRSFIPPTKGK